MSSALLDIVRGLSKVVPPINTHWKWMKFPPDPWFELDFSLSSPVLEKGESKMGQRLQQSTWINSPLLFYLPRSWRDSFKASGSQTSYPRGNSLFCKRIRRKTWPSRIASSWEREEYDPGNKWPHASQMQGDDAGWPGGGRAEIASS